MECKKLIIRQSRKIQCNISYFPQEKFLECFNKHLNCECMKEESRATWSSMYLSWNNTVSRENFKVKRVSEINSSPFHVEIMDIHLLSEKRDSLLYILPYAIIIHHCSTALPFKERAFAFFILYMKSMLKC